VAIVLVLFAGVGCPSRGSAGTRRLLRGVRL